MILTIHIQKMALVPAALLALLALPFSVSFAETSTQTGIQKALTVPEGAALFSNHNHDGSFSLFSSTFSGHANGMGDAPSVKESSNLVGDQRVYALLIDGKYDFTYDSAANNNLQPYIAGGVGMAMYGQPVGTTASSGVAGSTEPLFRIGGGVAYKLDSKWNMDLGYKAGYTAHNGDRLFTGRGQEAVDMQTLNMGMKYKF